MKLYSASWLVYTYQEMKTVKQAKTKGLYNTKKNSCRNLKIWKHLVILFE